MPSRWCIGCGTLFDFDTTGTQRCPPCQASATARRNTRPSSSSRGYDGEYQRNRPLIIRQARGGRPCHICKKPIQPRQKVTVEHIKPLRDGGTSNIANLAPAHSACNTAWNRGQS